MDHATSQAMPSAQTLILVRVDGRYQDENGHWRLRVETKSGRVIDGVWPSSPDEGLRSGSRPRLPVIDAVGVLGRMDEDSNTGSGVWLGCLDWDIQGMHQADPDDAVSLHPSGLASATARNGQFTWRQSNGDTVSVGPSETPYSFQVRDENGKLSPAPVFRRAMFWLLDLPLTKKITISAAKALRVIFDASKRSLIVGIGEDAMQIRDGGIFLTTEMVEIGPDPAGSTAVALAAKTFANDRQLRLELEETRKKLNEEIRARQALSDRLTQHLTAFNIHIHPVISPGVPTGLPAKPDTSFPGSPVPEILEKLVDTINPASTHLKA